MRQRIQHGNWIVALAAILWLAVGMPVSRAALQTYSETATSGEGDWPTYVTVNMPKFNTGYGVLEGVEFRVRAYFDTGSFFGVENLDSVEDDFTGTMTVSGSADWTSGSPTTTLNDGVTASGVATDVPAFDGSFDFDPVNPATGNSYKSVNLSGDATYSTYTVPDDGSWANFSVGGGGTFAVNLSGLVPVDALTVTAGGQSKDWASIGQAYVAVEFTVVYTFIPEPISLLLLGAGCGLLCLRRPRRRHVAA